MAVQAITVFNGQRKQLSEWQCCECEVLNLQGIITYSAHNKLRIHCEYRLWGQVPLLYIPCASSAHLPSEHQVIFM